METRYAERCFRKAARPAREQLKRDRQRVTEIRTRRVLAYLEEHLFEPNFTVRGALQDLKLRDNNISSTFRTKIGEPPKAYVSRLRFETAVRMLCDPKTPIWRIAEMIGYETIGGFSKASIPIASNNSRRKCITFCGLIRLLCLTTRRATQSKRSPRMLCASWGEHQNEV